MWKVTVVDNNNDVLAGPVMVDKPTWQEAMAFGEGMVEVYKTIPGVGGLADQARARICRNST